MACYQDHSTLQTWLCFNRVERDDEHIPGRQQGGAIDLLRGLQEMGVTWLFCPIRCGFQEQLWGVTFPKVLKVLLFPSNDCQQGWFVAVKLRVQGEPGGTYELIYLLLRTNKIVKVEMMKWPKFSVSLSKENECCPTNSKITCLQKVIF